MIHWFKKNKSIKTIPLQADIHSHLLPGIDDGVKTIEESIQVITRLRELGYRHLTTTPHVMSDIYRNTSQIILSRLDEVRAALTTHNVNITLSAAAEYYVDETLLASLQNNEKLLTIGGQYLLFETNFINEPLYLKEFIFLANSKGYRLIMAHPERYLYLNNNMAKAEDLIARGVLFQVNISSFTGYYSRSAQEMARRLVERRWVHWLGTDCHHMQHANLVLEALDNKYFQKALNLPLLNNTLE